MAGLWIVVDLRVIHVVCAYIDMKLQIEIFSHKLNLKAGMSLGGYSVRRSSKADSNQLEINGISFCNTRGNDKIELCSIDALYAGELAKLAPNNLTKHIFAASHTHYAPMLDRFKPLIGAHSQDAIDCYLKAINEAQRVKVTADICRIYKANIDVPIYRRFDYPSTAISRLLSRYCGMYPNEEYPVDRNIYIFEFAEGVKTLFTLIYHACHPVSRSDHSLLSPDYIGAVRSAVRERFNAVPSLFLLGCAGDIRPKYALKRKSWLPRSRLNWRFEPWAMLESELAMDSMYKNAVNEALLVDSIPLDADSLDFKEDVVSLKNFGDINFNRMTVGKNISFEFLPFEISHEFHLDAQKINPFRFIVSCADDVIGYLPHPNQLSAGGYEVDGSRNYMNINSRVELNAGKLW